MVDALPRIVCTVLFASVWPVLRVDHKWAMSRIGVHALTRFESCKRTTIRTVYDRNRRKFDSTGKGQFFRLIFPEIDPRPGIKQFHDSISILLVVGVMIFFGPMFLFD